MKKALTFSIFCLFATPFFAQSSAVDNAAMNSTLKEEQLHRVMDKSARNVTQFDGRYDGVKGTPFLFEDWTLGSLQLKDSTFGKNPLSFKFDLINNEVWVKTNDIGERILFSKEILVLKLNRPDGRKYVFKKLKLPIDPTRNYHYFSLVLFEGNNFTLVKDTRKVFRKANLEDRGVVTYGKAYDWFEEINRYYIQKAKGDFKEIVLKRGNLIKMVEKTQEKEVEKFCKEHGLRGQLTDDEATAIVRFMEGLK
jgi:hypothetical protein